MAKKKRAFLVMPRNKRVVEGGLQTSKGVLDFKSGKTSMMIGDENLAREVDAEYGLKGKGDVWVAQDERVESWLRDDARVGQGVHRYFWGNTPRYANAWEDFEARRKDKRNVSTGDEPEVSNG